MLAGTDGNVCQGDDGRPRSPENDPSAATGDASRFDTTFTPGKIFVGGLASETSEADLKEYFAVYGALSDVVVMRGTPPLVLLGQMSERFVPNQVEPPLLTCSTLYEWQTR